MSVILILSLVIPTACVPGKKTATVTESPATSTEISQLQSQVAQLQGKIASLPEPTDYSEELQTLQAKLDAIQPQLDAIQPQLNATLAEVDKKLADWEAKQTTAKEEEEEAVIATTRWNLDATSSESTTNVTLTADSTRSIRDEDTYKIYLTIYNHTLADVNDLYVELSLAPKSGDVVYIDDANTYLDSVRAPYYFWDMDVVTRGTDKYTRRIVFTSEEISVPAATDADMPSETLLTLELNLEYK